MENRPSREFDFELPVGYTDEDGQVHRIASLRKMTGHEEALLADRKLRQNAARLVTQLLAACVKRIGEIAPVPRNVISELTSPDRNFLLLQLRRITFGDAIEATYVCPSCGESTRITHDLDEVPVRRLNGEGHRDVVVELADGWESPGGDYYTSMVFRLPTGVDEERISPLTRENASIGMNALLTRCLVALGDMPNDRREALGTKVLTDLTMGDRAAIDRAFRQDMPGLDLTRSVVCDTCGRTFRTTIDLTGFFSVQQ